MTEITTSAFLNKGEIHQFTYIRSLYPTALKLKAETKSKPQELIKLDEWYQTALPKALKSRNPSHLTHEELINLIKWKQCRGKFRPKLKELVTMNSPRVVVTESKKAFRALEKKGDLSVAVAYLCNLKGIGPSTASAILTAYKPEIAAFMADECLAAVPEIEGIDCSTGEYLDLMRHLREASARLTTSTHIWTPHQVEMTLWTHYTLLMLKPELLHGGPDEYVVAPTDTEDSNSNSLGSRGFTDEDTNGSAVTNGEKAAAILSVQDLDDESSFAIADEPNSNSSQYLKDPHESSSDSPVYHSQLEVNGPDVGGLGDETAMPPFCSTDHGGLDVNYEPEAKRVKVD